MWKEADIFIKLKRTARDHWRLKSHPFSPSAAFVG
jgi:hypothetical protein